MTIGKRIRQLREQQGYSQTYFAKKLNVSKQTLYKYENGIITNIPSDKVEKIAEYCGVTPSYIMGWEDDATPAPVYSKRALPEIPPYDGIFPIAVKRLPVLGYVSCGNPIFMNEEREVYVEVGTNINAHFILIARGDSMINARIHEGDLVFIQSTPQVENGQIAVVAIGDEATLKRFYYYPETQQICLQSENPAYAPMIFTGQQLEDIRVLGRAIAFQSDVR